MKFKDFLLQVGLTPAKFAKINKLSTATTYRVFHGKRVSMETAKQIEDSTKGKTTIKEILETQAQSNSVFKARG